jgi:hypothetical protein
MQSQPWKHYTSYTRGWGCVYHSFQNAVLHVNSQDIPLNEIINRVGSRAPPTPSCQVDHRWIEPAQLKPVALHFFPDHSILAYIAKWIYKGNDNSSLCSITTRDEYTPLDTVEPLLACLHNGGALVIDDGIYGHAVIWDGANIIKIDPHSTVAAQLSIVASLEELLRYGVMILALIKRTTTTNET